MSALGAFSTIENLRPIEEWRVRYRQPSLQRYVVLWIRSWTPASEGVWFRFDFDLRDGGEGDEFESLLTELLRSEPGRER